MERGPLVVPGAAVVAGAELALRSPSGSPVLAVGLLAAGLALGARAGLATCGLALGLLCVWTRPGGDLEGFDLGRPVVAEAIRLGPWKRGVYGWSASARLQRIGQGQRVERVRKRVWLSLGGTDAPPSGRRIRARGRLGRSPTLHNGGEPRPGALGLRVKSRRLLHASGPGDRWRERLRAGGLGRARGSDGVALARALVLGDTGSLRPPLVQALRRAGLAHLLALSGLHVGILAGAGLWLGRLSLGRAAHGPWRWLLPAMATLLLPLVAGPRPAVLRASLMALLTFGALARGSRPLSWNALAAVLAAMVAIEPELLRELGFLLTAAATAGILWWVGTARGRGAASTAIGVSVAAQLFTLPWTLPTFALLTPTAWFHNLWAVPWTALALILALGWMALAAISPAAGRATEGWLEPGVAPFRWISRLAAGPWWSWPLAVSRVEAVALSLLGALALRRPAVVAVPVVVGLGLAAAAGFRPEAGDPELVMLDVGQGEAVLIRDGEVAALVDGGGWARGDIAGRVLVPALARHGVDALRAIVLTHPDLDHCGGLAGVAAYLPVEEVWTPAGWPPERCVVRLLSLPGAVWRPVWVGWRGHIGRWRLRALAPQPGDRSAGNDRSLVLRVEARGFAALLTGDIGARGESALVAATAAELLRSDLLKVPHHGSRTSSGDRLLAAVAPRLAWISAGSTNRYGHPHPAVLARLGAHGARVLRTDRDGQIRLRVGAAGTVHLSMPGAPK